MAKALVVPYLNLSEHKNQRRALLFGLELQQDKSDQAGFGEGVKLMAKIMQEDVLIGQGETIQEVCTETDLSEQTYFLS